MPVRDLSQAKRIHFAGNIYSVPLILFRFLISLLIEGSAVMCVKPYLPAFSFGTFPGGLVICGGPLVCFAIEKAGRQDFTHIARPSINKDLKDQKTWGAYGMLPPTGCISQNRFGWPKSHRRQGSRDEHQHLDRIHEMKYFCIFIIGTFDFFIKQFLLRMRFIVSGPTTF